MRPSHLFPATLLVLAGLTPAGAADLSKIDLALKDEPSYTTRAPKYCLLVFGPEAKTRVWLVHDGDVLHVRASPDGKSAPTWRQFKNARYGAQIGDVWEEGGKALYKGLAYFPGRGERTIRVTVGGKRQAAGQDMRGVLTFAASAKDAPVVHFNGPLTLDLYHEQQPLRSHSDVEMTAVVGTHGVGKGTFALFYCQAYPRGAWPTAVIEFPGKEKSGRPVTARIRLNEN